MAMSYKATVRALKKTIALQKENGREKNMFSSGRSFRHSMRCVMWYNWNGIGMSVGYSLYRYVRVCIVNCNLQTIARNKTKSDNNNNIYRKNTHTLDTRYRERESWKEKQQLTTYNFQYKCESSGRTRELCRQNFGRIHFSKDMPHMIVVRWLGLLHDLSKYEFCSALVANVDSLDRLISIRLAQTIPTGYRPQQHTERKKAKKKYDRNFDRTVVQKKRRESNTAHKKHRPQQRARTIFKIHVSIKLINWIDSIHASNSQKRCPLYLFLAIPMFASCVILQRFCCYFTFLPFGLSVGFCIFVACTQPTEPYVHFFSKFSCVYFLVPYSFCIFSRCSVHFFLVSRLMFSRLS